MAYEGHIAGVGDRPPGKRAPGAGHRVMQSPLGPRDRRAAGRGRRGRVRGGGPRVRERGWHRQPARHHRARTRSPSWPPDRASSRPRCSTPTARFASAGGDVRDAGRAQARARDRDRARGRLPGIRARRAQPRSLALPPARPAARPLRGRRRGPDAGPGRPARDLRIGDRVYFRHAKAGELCERFDALHLVSGDRVVDEVPTYRGEGKTFL